MEILYLVVIAIVEPQGDHVFFFFIYKMFSTTFSIFEVTHSTSPNIGYGA